MEKWYLDRKAALWYNVVSKKKRRRRMEKRLADTALGQGYEMYVRKPLARRDSLLLPRLLQWLQRCRSRPGTLLTVL